MNDRRSQGTLTYDGESGQSYIERVVRAPASMLRPSYDTECIGSRKDLERFKNAGPGCSSLVDMAARSFVKHWDSDPEVLACMPQSLGEKVFLILAKYRLVSFRFWQQFAKVYPDSQLAGLIMHSQRFPRHSVFTPDYVEQMFPTGPDVNWLTYLYVKETEMNTNFDSWRLLTKCKNLAALVVLNDNVDGTNPTLSIFHDWARAAERGDAFQHLRIMAVRWRRSSIFDSFRCDVLHTFPSLCFFYYTSSMGNLLPESESGPSFYDGQFLSVWRRFDWDYLHNALIHTESATVKCLNVMHQLCFWDGKPIDQAKGKKYNDVTRADGKSVACIYSTSRYGRYFRRQDHSFGVWLYRPAHAAELVKVAQEERERERKAEATLREIDGRAQKKLKVRKGQKPDLDWLMPHLPR
ncbi:hypothetical protein BDY21DRAFT_190292 [Lineolata rhizophorae]|uniref:Uncharacterized protein n=1 Tax=Lineolata rhizophorae TaxID=578093 RepID=A0A6A6P603_9PEZI|nr:hypothetical protein BDY21DRAFT_190292 [Lineolata rhizophorae]